MKPSCVPALLQPSVILSQAEAQVQSYVTVFGAYFMTTECLKLQAWPDTPRPSLPDQAPTLSDDSPPAPAQLDYTPSPESEQAMTAPSLAAQHSAHAHTSETAVQGQHTDSGHHNSSPDCCLEEEHVNQTDGSNGSDQESTHFIITTVAADQADREEEVSDAEQEEQDSAHLTITHAAADQAEEEEEDEAAKEEEYEQHSEPDQDPASGLFDEDDVGDGTSRDEEDHHDGQAVMMSSSTGSSGTTAVPCISSTASSDEAAGPNSARDPLTDDEPGSEDVGRVTGAEPRSPWQPGPADVQLAPDVAEEEQCPLNEGDEEDEEHPVYDSLDEEEEGEGEEVSSSEEEDAAEEEAAETSEYEEDETEGLFESEDEEDVPSDQDGETVAGLHRRIKELESQDSGYTIHFA